MSENIKSESALREEAVLQFWKEKKIFQKSLEKEAPKGKYVFYDGPPFATGTPHYGHILGSTAKDVIGRYQTMCGFTVPRRWGWDCHGLPIENIVEKDLNISGKKAIEELGIDKFVEHARSKVLTYVAEWEKTINRIGRWVDFSNSYKTMDNTFIESVWWALGELNKKELLYEGVRVLAYCPRCETPIANSEIAMDNSYKDIADISVYVKFRLKDIQSEIEGKSPSTSSGPKDTNTYLLAWTTTPWTLPGNTAIAINNEIIYLYVSHSASKGKEVLILAKESFDLLKDKFINPEIIKEVKGKELVGLSYEPIFPYYKNVDMPNKENIWKVWHADFVTLDKGTGIAHEAPAFGEDDMNLAKEHNIPFIRHVEPNGTFSKEVVDFTEMKVKAKDTTEDKDAHLRTDIEVIKYLQNVGAYFDKEKIIHSYPHCYRCETPLLYYALPSWFVNIQKIKSESLKNAESMNWVPAHLKEGRFKNTMESAPDWTISRNRYWASPLPIWKSESGKMMFVNSLEDLKSKVKKSGNKYFVMRHGGSESNLKNIISAKPENVDHLTEEGRKQVLDLAQKLKNQKIDLIICSDFMRTRETAEIVKKELGILADLIFDKRIREIDASDYEGKSWDLYPRFFEESKVGAESLLNVKKRISEFLYDLENKYQNKNILIVSHESVIRLSFTYDYLDFNFESLTEYRKRFPVFKNAEVRELNFIPLSHNADFELDLHRPYIDSIVLVDKNGEEYKRIPEVIDCWFESGSMPFAQDHYPFENKDWQKENFPSGFVAEYLAQTRTWFYYTHTISSILFNHAPFKNVVTTGTILAEDGQKMSKSKNNFPDPWILFDKYGVDALRFYLMSCPVMKGEDINFSEKAVQDISNKIINRLNNVLSFYELYRDKEIESEKYKIKSKNVLNEWILSRLNELITETTNGMKEYDVISATKPMEFFIEDLSTWYLRRSREKIKEDDKETKQTLYFVLKNLSKLMAPFTPFTGEEIWQKLKNEKDVESVHLANWPEVSETIFDKLFHKKNKIIEEMEETRKIVTLGLQARQKVGIPVRQPLNKLKVKSLELSNEYLELIKDEINVREIVEDKNIEGEVMLDTEITSELKEEGQCRELIRAIQDVRKKEGLTPNDKISLILEANEDGKNMVEKFKEEIKKVVLAKEIKFEKNDGTEVNIGELIFKFKINK